MDHKSGKALTALILFLVLIPAAIAHTPLPKGHGNHDLETALPIPQPTKSWVLYRSLHEAGEPEYFSMEISFSERLVLSLFTPLSAEEGFAPSLVVMGPGIAPQGELPDWVEVPAEYGAVHVEGVSHEPEYEPFTPGSYRFTAEYRVDVPEDGVYYAVVYEPEEEGRYGMAVGYREVFTLVEWLTIPFSTVTIHQWEGQPLLQILAPMLLTLMIGVYVAWRSEWTKSLPGAAGLLAGLLYEGSGALVAYQMLLASMAALSSSAMITLIFALAPFVLGVLIIRWVRGGMRVESIGDRAKLVLYGLLGFLFWGGMLVGPVIVILLGLLAPVTVSGD
jgi:hypothetical protein